MLYGVAKKMLALWIRSCAVLLGLFVLSCSAKINDVPGGMGGASGSCPASQLLCGGVCVDRVSANCAACGNPCSADQICDLGQCKPKAAGCTAGLIDCGGCVDPRTNVNNCGACGTVCEICDQGVCKQRMQGCSAGLTSCNGSCVDLLTTTANCGSCGKVCETGKSCSAGACVCAPGTTACGAACVNTQTDSLNCGTCGTACSAGRTCQAGTCQCPAGRALCGDTCSDLQTDALHCGACTTACSNGKTCTAGVCTCAPGQAMCGDACVDVQTNDANCGACGTACSLGQVCTAGKCGGGGGLREDGCQGLTANLTLSQIAVYQTVKIPVMQNGTEVAAAARKTDIVAGRDASFRLFFTTGTGFTAHEVSARVFVQNGGTIDTVYAKKTISASSTEAALDSTIVVTVPKDKITPTTKYAVEIVDCGTAVAGTAVSPRFPAADGVNLGARQTGALKITFVPIQANSLTPDTTETALKVYRDYMQAMYPASSIVFNVTGGVTSSDDADWNGMLDLVTAKRASDAPTDDVYYYGLLKPTATFREYCNGGCTAGVGYVVPATGRNAARQRTALGLAFGDAVSAETLAHEVGHNHGRNHAPCVQGGTISGTDASYPYANGAIGVYGWDPRTLKLIAPDRTDIMGYCNSKWISDYTYDALLERVATLNNVMQSVYVPPELVQRWRVLLVGPRGARFGIPITEPGAPSGEAEPAEVLDVTGNPIANVTVYRTLVSDIDAASIEVPWPKAGWHSIRVAGAPPVQYEP